MPFPRTYKEHAPIFTPCLKRRARAAISTHAWERGKQRWGASGKHAEIPERDEQAPQTRMQHVSSSLTH
eukprot:2739862-Pleurochrysis_carterae.AAC.1